MRATATTTTTKRNELYIKLLVSVLVLSWAVFLAASAGSNYTINSAHYELYIKSQEATIIIIIIIIQSCFIIMFKFAAMVAIYGFELVMCLSGMYIFP